MVDLEIRCVVGLVSGVAVDQGWGKNLPAACESSEVILQVIEVGWYFFRLKIYGILVRGISCGFLTPWL